MFELQNVAGMKYTFEWKIENFGLEESHWSPQFKVDECSFCFCIESFSRAVHTEKFWGFWLLPLSLRFYKYPLYYAMKVLYERKLDVPGREGTLEREEYQQILMCVPENELKKKLETGTLTLQFTMKHLEDAAQGRNQSDEEPFKLLKALSNDLSTFYESKKNTDCVLRVGDAQFSVHRAVLSARSPVFSAMFHHDTAENRSGEVDIPDIEASIFNDILYYMYSGTIRGLTADTVTAMYTAGDKYSLTEMKEHCINFLKFNLTVENIYDVALLAHTHGETELEKRVVHFIDDRLEELSESEKWKHFTNSKPLLANKILYSALMISRTAKKDK